MTTRHKDIISDKESNIIKDIVYKSMIMNPYYKNEMPILHNKKNELYDSLDYSLDRLYEYSFDTVDSLIRDYYDDEE